MPATLRDPRLPDRFWAKVEVVGECWLWTGATRSGYAKFGIGKKTYSAHRVSFERLIGPIPPGKQLDHICYVRRCVNPAHLQPVSHRENGENLARAHRDCASGVRGVWWDKRRRKWAVQVCSAGKKYTPGYFERLEDAAEVARDLRNRLHTNNLSDRKVV